MTFDPTIIPYRKTKNFVNGWEKKEKNNQNKNF